LSLPVEYREAIDPVVGDAIAELALNAHHIPETGVKER
jgi:hypothetical protein